MNTIDLTPVKPGQKITARMWNKVLKLLGRKITASGGVGVTETSTGWHLRGGPTGAGIPEMIIADADMAADDTEYNAKYLEADGTEGDTVVVRRSNGVLVNNNDVGFIGKDSSGQLIFIHAHTMPKHIAAADTIGVLTEGTEAAATDTWSADATDNGLRLNITTRVGYFHAGDETLYGYTRQLLFDNMGHLLSIGAETRVTIDAPGPCP